MNNSHRQEPVMTAIVPRTRLLRSLIAGLALSSLVLVSVTAQAAGYQKGPAPTVAALEAKGPFATATATLAAGADFGSGTTIYYPTDRSAGSFGLLVLCPGFVSTAGLYAGIAQRIASHGFVVTVVSTKSLTDQPKARGAQMMSVMKAVLAQNKVQGVAYAGQIDESRVAFGGHSAGGSGTFYAAASQPQLKALVGLMPGEPGTNFTPFTGIRIPTLILTGSIDALANSWADPYFKQLDPTLPAAHIDLAGIGHLSLWTTATQASQGRIAKYVTAWVKRFVDEDTRYTPFVKAAASDMSSFDSHGDY
jgi:dienelactone hydrolase